VLNVAPKVLPVRSISPNLKKSKRVGVNHVEKNIAATTMNRATSPTKKFKLKSGASYLPTRKSYIPKEFTHMGDLNVPKK